MKEIRNLHNAGRQSASQPDVPAELLRQLGESKKLCASSPSQDSENMVWTLRTSASKMGGNEH